MAPLNLADCSTKLWSNLGPSSKAHNMRRGGVYEYGSKKHNLGHLKTSYNVVGVLFSSFLLDNAHSIFDLLISHILYNKMSFQKDKFKSIDYT